MTLKEQSKELIRLNDIYHKYLFLSQINSIEEEMNNYKKEFGYEH